MDEQVCQNITVMHAQEDCQVIQSAGFCLLRSNQDTLICRSKESSTSRDDRKPGHYGCLKATRALETWLMEPAHTNESARDREQPLETPGACITAINKISVFAISFILIFVVVKLKSMFPKHLFGSWF